MVYVTSVLMAVAAMTLASPCHSAVDFWTLPAATKVTMEQVAPAGKSTCVHLYAAKREVAAFQIALRSASEISAVTLTPSRLDSPRSFIGKSRISIWKQHYIKTSKGMLPDGLTPFTQETLAPEVTQPVYVEISVPESAVAGDYQGTISLTGGGQIDITLTVYDFELPETPAIRTAFGFYPEHVAHFEEVSQGSRAFQKLKEAYYEMMLDHGLSLYYLPVDLASAEAEKYLSDPRMTSYTIWNDPDDTRFRTLLDRLKSGGWLKKGFVYLWDEPATEEHAKYILENGPRLRKLEPELNVTVPYHVKATDSGRNTYDVLLNNVTIWCYITPLYDEKWLDSRRGAGDEVWNYVCVGPGPPWANFFITNDGNDHRVLFWQNWKYRTTGLLYWASNFWEPSDRGTKDPWKDMATIKWINPDCYGDGSLLYPGRPVGLYGPMPSLRLKIIRQGIQDFAYFHLAEKAAGRKVVDRIVDSEITSWTEFQKDPLALEQAKRELAKIIVSRKR